jgi:hypothetical protein
VVANPTVIAPTIQVRASTVDDLLAEMRWTGVDFVKLDIEGSEVKAVRGMAALLSRPDAPIIFYESNYYTLAMFGETPQTLMRALEGFGYHCYLIDGSWLRPVRSSEFQPSANVDYVALKRPLPTLQSWQVGPPLTIGDMAERVAAAAIDQNLQVRLCTARALADADPMILAQPTVQKALLTLQQDQDETVRTAAAWWRKSSVNPLRRWWWALRSAMGTPA